MLPKSNLPALLLTAMLSHGAIAQPVEPAAVNGADAATYIRSALPLDEPRHLCIDPPGHGETVNLEADITVHTCKDGMWNLDQRFQWSADGTELEMPQYGTCLVAREMAEGASLSAAECGTAEAKWVNAQSRLKPASDTSLCITIAEGTSELTPGGKKFPQRYRARALSLEACDDAALERQLWAITQPLALDAALLPPSGSLPVE